MGRDKQFEATQSSASKQWEYTQSMHGHNSVAIHNNLILQTTPCMIIITDYCKIIQCSESKIIQYVANNPTLQTTMQYGI